MEHDPTATVAFLRAEEAATQLAEELKLLAEETRRYDGAAGSLEEVGSAVRSLSVAVQATGERTAAVVESLRLVGAPELIDGVRAIETALNEARQHGGELSDALASLRQLTETHGERQAASVASVTEKIDYLYGRLQALGSEGASKAEVAELSQKLRQLGQEVGERLLALERDSSAIREGIAALDSASAKQEALELVAADVKSHATFAKEQFAGLFASAITAEDRNKLRTSLRNLMVVALVGVLFAGAALALSIRNSMAPAAQQAPTSRRH